MKTCTCPRIATRSGFVINGTNALCPFHGKPLPEVPVRPAPDGMGDSGPGDRLTEAPTWPRCWECGFIHAPIVRCDFVDET